MRAGDAADVVPSFDSANVGNFCQSGGWIDLNRHSQRDGIDIDIFPAPTRYYTSYDGKRCALPILADAYGLYYNKDLLREGRADRAAEDVSELMDYAKKLTARTPTGRSRSSASTRRSASSRTPAHVGAALRRQVDRRPGQVDARPPTRPGRRC